MSRSSSSSTITLVPSTPPAPKYLDTHMGMTIAVPTIDGGVHQHLGILTRISPVKRPCLDLAATKVSKPIAALLSAAIGRLDRPLRIVGLLATPDSGCHMYADMTARACKAHEVVFDKLDMSSCRGSSDDDTAFDKVYAAIETLNDDVTVDGLIVYFPLFNPERDARLRALIHPRIDVEGVHPTSLRRSYARAPETVDELTANPAAGTVYPCTALAVFRALQATEVALYNAALPANERFRGKTVTIVNRSETVGRPLAGMLANAGARVYSVDIDSTHVYERSPLESSYTATPYPGGHPPLATLLAESDVVVSAVPGDTFKIRTAELARGAVCIDLSEHGNFEDDLRTRAGVFAPRLGSVTILMLKMNALVLHCRARALTSLAE